MSGEEFVGLLDLLFGIVWLVLGLISLRIAAMERRRGSTTWKWALPGATGIFLTVWGLFRLWWWWAA